METDEELVRRTLSEGSHHFGVLIQRYADYLFGLGMWLTSGNKELAEDMSQQAFMKSYTYLKSFDPQKSFKHWLTGIPKTPTIPNIGINMSSINISY